MTSIKITKIDVIEDSAMVHWSIDGGQIKLLNVIFDNNGSCSNLSVDPATSQVLMPSLVVGTSYSVKISGLDDTEWIHSDYVYVSI